MASYNTNEFRGGLKILIDGDPCAIVENEFVKPGKGQAFNRVKIRNLKTGRVVDKTFKSGDSVEAADVIEQDLQYLYSDGEHWHFMFPDTFEQLAADDKAVGDAKQWLNPGVRGDTAQGGVKPAKLETGAVVRVPLFVEEGELIKVDTRSGEYVSRVKS